VVDGLRAQVWARLKPVARRAADRVVQPYVDQAVDRLLAGLRPASLPAHFTVLQEALHEARTIALADVPPGAGTMLSAGASGRWYFDWVAEHYGRVPRHIGVEAYSARPDDLPANVDWLAADIAGPEGIAAIESHSVDLCFSGQNLEHLWPGQMVRFFCEANRVLREGGLLVVDSPNRALTAAYRWSMGEHTVELTPGEAEELLALAGFALERMKGVWLCRHDGRVMPLGPDPAATGPEGLVRRFALAAARPDDSFIWWAEARRVAPPDRPALTEQVRGLFERHWPERVARVEATGGEPCTWADGRPGVRAAAGTACQLLRGPSMPVPPGTFEMRLELAWSDPPPGAWARHDAGDRAGDAGCVGRLEVMAGERTVAATDVVRTAAPEGSLVVTCPFELDQLEWGVGIRLVSTGTAEVRAPLALAIAPDPWRAMAAGPPRGT
jgi:SAM-dependent methyltransferase